jgi:hypothetical protein
VEKGHGSVGGVCFEGGSVARGREEKGGRGVGVGASAWRREKEERGGWCGVHQRTAASSSPGRQARVALLPREQGRVAAVGDAAMRANEADKQDRGEAGPGVSSGVGREKGREAGRRQGADMRARAARFKLDLNRNQNSNETKLISNSFKL